MIDLEALQKTEGFRYGYRSDVDQAKLSYIAWLLQQPSEDAPIAVAKLRTIFEYDNISGIAKEPITKYTSFRVWLFPTWPEPVKSAPPEWRSQADVVINSWDRLSIDNEAAQLYDVGYLVVVQIADDSTYGLVLLEDFSWAGPIRVGKYPLSEGRDQLEKSIIPINVNINDSVVLVPFDLHTSTTSEGLATNALWAEWADSGYGPHVGVITDAPEEGDSDLRSLLDSDARFATERESAHTFALERYPNREPEDLFFDLYQEILHEGINGRWFKMASIWDVASYLFKYGVEPIELDQPEYRIDLDQLAKMLGIKTFNDLTEDHLWESGDYAFKQTYDSVLEETEDEDEAISAAETAREKAEQEEQSDYFNNYQSALLNTAGSTLTRGLGLDVDQPSGDDWTVILTPDSRKNETWATVAMKVIEAINGEGYFQVNDLQELIAVGPYTSLYKAVIDHLESAAKAYPRVYGNRSNERMFYDQLR